MEKEAGGDGNGEGEGDIARLPPQFLETFVMQGLVIDAIEPGRVVSSLKLSPRLLDGHNYLHTGIITMLVDVVGSAVIYSLGSPFSGVSVEINSSYFDAAYLDEEIEIDAKSLRVGKAVAVVSVEFRKKSTGKIFAQGRHTKYLPASSKL